MCLCVRSSVSFRMSAENRKRHNIVCTKLGRTISLLLMPPALVKTMALTSLDSFLAPDTGKDEPPAILTEVCSGPSSLSLLLPLMAKAYFCSWRSSFAGACRKYMGWKWIGEVSGDISSEGYTKLWEPLVWGSVHIRVIKATRERKGGNHPRVQVFLDASRPYPENPKASEPQPYKQRWFIVVSIICTNQPVLWLG